MARLIKIIFSIILVTSIFTACIKEVENYDPNAQYLIEKPIIEEYAKANLNNPGFHQNSGIWYEVIDPGETGSYTYTVRDTLNSKVTYTHARVKYEGKLLNGVVFDKFEADTGAITPVYFNFTTGDAALIQAWNLVFIPKNVAGVTFDAVTQTGLQVGSKIRFVTPSIWGYRNNQQAKIPANSPLDFTIEVISLSNQFTTPAN